MNLKELKSETSYLLETRESMWVSFVCNKDKVYGARGLYLRIPKNSNEQDCLRFGYIPRNLDWDRSKEISLVQAKALVVQYSNLVFDIGGPYSDKHKITKETIQSLYTFYQAWYGS